MARKVKTSRSKWYQQKHKPHELDELDRRIIQIISENPSITDEEIRKIPGITLARSAVNARRQNPEFKRVIAELFKPAKKILEEAQPEAARVMRKLLRNEDGYLKVKAAAQILKPVLNAIGDIEDEVLTIKMKRSDGTILILGNGKDDEDV